MGLIRNKEKKQRRAIVASAAKIDTESRKQLESLHKNSENWQNDSWAYYDLVPEVKSSARFYGNSISKVRLFAGAQPDPQAPPISVEDAADPEKFKDNKPFISEALAQAAAEEMARLKNQKELLDKFATCGFLVGEVYLIGLTDKPADDPSITPSEEEDIDPDSNEKENWSIYSDSEIKIVNGKATIIANPGDQNGRAIGPNDYMVRLWEKHPRWSQKADSNMRALLRECNELLTLSRSILAVAQSRLSNGILTVPDELSFSTTTPDTQDEGDGNTQADPFDTDLMNSMIEPVKDESSAASLVPLVVHGPSEFLTAEFLRHIDLSREIDDHVIERCNFLIDRLAHGLDVPPEVVTGIAELNHWSAWQVDESTFKSYLEPTVSGFICESLTIGFLRPMLAARKNTNGTQAFTDEEIQLVMVAYDATALVVHPNRSKDAETLHQDNELSGAALRRETGFAEEDAPDDEELIRRLALNPPRGSSPELVVALLKRAGILPADIEITPAAGDPVVTVPDDDIPQETDPQEMPDDPIPDSETAAAFASIPLPPVNKTTDRKLNSTIGKKLVSIDQNLRQKLLVACDAALTRALEKAGAKLRSKTSKNKGITAAIGNVPNSQIASILGPTLVASVASDKELMDGSFSTLEPKFMAWTSQAQRNALSVAEINLDQMTEEQQNALQVQQSEYRNKAWDVLVAGLSALAIKQLYDTSVEEPLGEFDESLSVPPSLVREAMAYAGGSTSITYNSLGGISLDGGNSPAGGIATGEFIMDQLSVKGQTVQGYEWVAEYDGPHPFEPHERLGEEGVQFSSWEDSQLAVDEEGSWLGTDYYRPGDHDGCMCSAVPLLLDEGDNE